MVVGVMQVELHVPNAQSLKDRRSGVQQVFQGVAAWLRMAPSASLIRIEEEYL